MKNRLLFILSLVAVASLFRWVSWAETGGIATIMSRRIAPFNTALAGFQEVVHRPNQVYNLAAMGEKRVVRKIMSNDPPKLILAIGSNALLFARKNFLSIPVVFTMVSNPSRIVKGQKKYVSGVRMETPWRVMFEHLKRIVPQLKRVGIILNPKRIEEDVSYIKIMAARYELEPIVRVVENTPQAISEFKNIEHQIEAFLMVPDPYILTPKFYEYILLSSLRRKFVLSGLSLKYTKAGSLFSVMGDNRDWGVQAGLIADRVLAGTSPGLIPYEFARKYSLSINLKTAEKIGIIIPQAIKEGADYIVE